MKPSEKYKRDYEELMKFKTEYLEYITLYPIAGRSLTENLQQDYVNPSRGVERNEGYSKLGILAGKAHSAYERHGPLIQSGLPGTLASPQNPLENWAETLNSNRVFNATRLITCLDQAIGKAQHAWTEAERNEKGFTGLVANYLRWPRELREAIEPGNPGLGRVANYVGWAINIFLPIAVAIISGTIVEIIRKKWNL